MTRCVLCTPILVQSPIPCTWGFFQNTSRIFKVAKALAGCLSAICHVFFTADTDSLVNLSGTLTYPADPAYEQSFFLIKMVSFQLYLLPQPFLADS